MVQRSNRSSRVHTHKHARGKAGNDRASEFVRKLFGWRVANTEIREPLSVSLSLHAYIHTRARSLLLYLYTHALSLSLCQTRIHTQHAISVSSLSLSHTTHTLSLIVHALCPISRKITRSDSYILQLSVSSSVIIYNHNNVKVNGFVCECGINLEFGGFFLLRRI